MTIERISVPAMNRLINTPISVLDKGFVRVVDYMGDDSSIVQAARVSYGKGTKTVSDDERLINYLMRHRHTTPFEMCEIKLHVKLPIFVARQWVRHRTASINEYSARYSELHNEFYIPSLDQIETQSTSNKQGRAVGLGRREKLDAYIRMEDASQEAYKNYEDLLALGVSRELARMVLPVNIYTSWYWKIDLHNLLHFIRLRSDSHAQYEIRMYSKAIEEIVNQWVPATWAAFKENLEVS